MNSIFLQKIAKFTPLFYGHFGPPISDGFLIKKLIKNIDQKKWHFLIKILIKKMIKFWINYRIPIIIDDFIGFWKKCRFWEVPKIRVSGIQRKWRFLEIPKTSTYGLKKYAPHRRPWVFGILQIIALKTGFLRVFEVFTFSRISRTQLNKICMKMKIFEIRGRRIIENEVRK